MAHNASMAVLPGACESGTKYLPLVQLLLLLMLRILPAPCLNASRGLPAIWQGPLQRAERSAAPEKSFDGHVTNTHVPAPLPNGTQ